MKNVYVKPAPLAGGGTVLVRDPETLHPLAGAGEWKSLSPFWSRRIRDKDVIDATAQAPKAAPVVSVDAPLSADATPPARQPAVKPA